MRLKGINGENITITESSINRITMIIHHTNGDITLKVTRNLFEDMKYNKIIREVS